jgi:hypothetical protein
MIPDLVEISVMLIILPKEHPRTNPLSFQEVQCSNDTDCLLFAAGQPKAC